MQYNKDFWLEKPCCHFISKDASAERRNSGGNTDVNKGQNVNKPRSSSSSSSSDKSSDGDHWPGTGRFPGTRTWERAATAAPTSPTGTAAAAAAPASPTGTAAAAAAASPSAVQAEAAREAEEAATAAPGVRMAEGGGKGGDAGGDPHKQKYNFGNRGVVRDLVYPNKAIVHFKLGGREEKAILLSKSITLDGRSPDEGR